MSNLTTSNVTDDARRYHFKIALGLKRELDAAQAVVRSINGRYRSALKQAEKAGIEPKDIIRTLQARELDPDVVIRDEQNFIRMMAATGVMPSIQQDIFGGLEFSPLTAEQQAEMDLEAAYDEGVAAGLAGRNRHTSRFPAGSEAWDTFDRGWLVGQARIAEGLGPKKKAGRPRKAKQGGKLDPSSETEGEAVH
jgi:hypothetical protein